MSWNLALKVSDHLNSYVKLMLRIDSHQHFWKFDPVRDNWITDEMSVIRKDFLPEDIEPVLKKNGFDGCVTVQSDQSEMENAFQLANAGKYDFIKAVVGWIDLQSVNVEQRLEYYQQYKKLKGFRHVLQGEARRDLMLRPDFKRGIGLLNKYNFTYDILIFPDQLQYSTELVSSFPEQKFVVDHMAKPYIREKNIDDWKTHIRRMASYENVYCKFSGFVTEADWKNWKRDDFLPYFDVVTEAFGIDRIMFGSDWPVCLVAGCYEEVVSISNDYFSSFTKSEQEKVFGLNAIKFYNLAGS
ncbi:MAG: amidohydrolase family protein [Flavisolibacter sp.]